MVSFKRLGVVYFIFFISGFAHAEPLGEYVAGSIVSNDYPIIYKFGKRGKVNLYFLDKDVMESSYVKKKNLIKVRFGQKTLVFEHKKEVDGDKMVNVEDKSFILFTLRIASYQSSKSFDEQFILGSWSNVPCLPQANKYGFEFFKNNRFVYTTIEENKKNANVYSWKIIRTESITVLRTSFPNTRLFFVNNFDNDKIYLKTQIDDKICSTSFIHLDSKINSLSNFISGKWARIDGGIRLPIEFDIGEKIGIKFENENIMEYYEWILSSLTNKIIILGPANARSLYPDNFSIERSDDNKLIIEFGGFKGRYIRIR